MLNGPPLLIGEPDCPAETDATYDLVALPFRTACLRNLSATHPGDPGQGGGIVRVGDCVSSSDWFGPAPAVQGPERRQFVGRVHEKACAGDGQYGKVLARAGAVNECPPASMKAAELEGSDTPRQVVCLEPGARR